MTLFSKPITAELRPREHRALYILLSFFIPAIVLTLVMIGLRIVPFGDKHSLAISDAKFYLNSQLNIARLFRGEENYLYSLGNGLGGNQWSSLAWGAFAPASLLSLFAKLETIPSWFTWTVPATRLHPLTFQETLSYIFCRRLPIPLPPWISAQIRSSSRLIKRV